MGNIIKPAASLVAICLVVGLCLAGVNEVSKEIISERINKDAQNQRTEVLSGAENFEKVLNWEKDNSTGLISEVYVGKANGKTIGYVFKALPKGYGGKIGVTIGISIDAKVKGVKIGDNNETPGLGSKVAKTAFYKQYMDKNIEYKLEVVKKKPSGDNEIEGISGATISSKAVTAGVNAAAEMAKIMLKEGSNEK